MRLTNAVVFSVLALNAPLLYSQNQPSEPGAHLRRFEIGGQLADLQLTEHAPLISFGYVQLPQFALGPGLTLNLNRHFAIDSTYNVTTSSFQGPAITWAGGRGSELLVGVRAEVRARHYGFFAFAKPGYVRWSNVLHTNLVFSYAPETQFATEVGGGLEYSPTARVHLRADLGDVIRSPIGDRCSFCGVWTNNVQTTAGVYFGMGRPIAQKPPSSDTKPSHRFFDKTNLALIGVGLLGQSADAITTQRFHSHGYEEEDPLARPFVDRGWGGQIAFGAVVNTALISVMYGLHKMGRHRIERIVPLPLAVSGAVMGYRNLQFY